MQNRPPTIGEYLLRKLESYGIEHIFGIPGDYVLRFYNLIEQSPIQQVGMTREDAAGYAADAYARTKGMGAVCVTYCVGGLSTVNAVAGAYAEKSPVVVISGAPGIKERGKDALLHHKVRDFHTQQRIYDEITVATALLDEPFTAFNEIDRVLDAVYRYKRPGYIEIPRDMVDVRGTLYQGLSAGKHISDPDVLDAAVDEACAFINKSKKPVILAGVELHRFGYQDKLIRLAEEKRIPVVATLLGKSVIPESHPLYLGIYEGAMGKQEVRAFVEDSDCVIILGAFMTDVNLGIYTANLDRARSIYATSEKLAVRYHTYEDVMFDDFIDGINSTKLRKRRKPNLNRAFRDSEPFALDPKAPLTVSRLFQHLNEFISDELTVIADVGDSLFGAVELEIHQHTNFISPAYYTSMGFAVPASVGAQFSMPDTRCLVIVGDGAFQMTGTELSTTVRHGFNPIILVLNNHGYGTERHLLEGPFNDIGCWNYSGMPTLFGTGRGFHVRTEGEFDEAIKAALAETRHFTLIEAELEKLDTSPALARLAERMAGTV
ncbi:preprotein translocase subunit Tim44 [Candidatus Poribacteria bacterium]|nr:MAG: preprotein translocase subunit Tim44 [Candidatus Poribacteria bacterium]